MEIPKVTPKQNEILLLLYRYRFLDRYHIQRFLNHKDPRRIKSWLKDLTDKNIIGRKYSKKLKENTKPAIYFLATKSKRILEGREEIEEKLLNRVYREKARSQKFIDHHLFLADIYFYLSSLTQKNKSKLHFFTKTDLTSHHYLPYNRPDAYIAAENKEGNKKRYFLEIIDAGTPRFMLRSKISYYIDYFDNNTWQKHTGYAFPSILIVCPDEALQNFLFKHIRQVLEEEVEVEISFYLTTREIVRSTDMSINIWKQVDDDEED